MHPSIHKLSPPAAATTAERDDGSASSIFNMPNSRKNSNGNGNSGNAPGQTPGSTPSPQAGGSPQSFDSRQGDGRYSSDNGNGGGNGRSLLHTRVDAQAAFSLEDLPRMARIARRGLRSHA